MSEGESSADECQGKIDTKLQAEAEEVVALERDFDGGGLAGGDCGVSSGGAEKRQRLAAALCVRQQRSSDFVRCVSESTATREGGVAVVVGGGCAICTGAGRLAAGLGARAMFEMVRVGRGGEEMEGDVEQEYADGRGRLW